MFREATVTPPPSARAAGSRFSVFFATLFALFALSATGCGGLINNTKEVEIGKGVNQEIGKEYALVESGDPLSKWARDLVAPLSAASARHRNPQEFGGYKVAVIADDELVNAFAAPGGYTYISTGLILSADTCGEIAGVLGHELGHVTERHGVKSLESAMAGETLAALFLGDSLAGDAARTIWGVLNATKFSQDHEKEADHVGVQISHDAGYNPYGLADFFAKILEMEKKSGGKMPQFLSSHPATKDRIRAVSNEIQSKYGNKVVAGKTQTYECRGTDMTLAQAKARIKGKELKVRSTARSEAAPKK